MITLLINLGLLSGRCSKDDRKTDHPHGHLVEDGLAGSLAERRDARQHGAASARMGQMERAAGTSEGTTRLS